MHNLDIDSIYKVVLMVHNYGLSDINWPRLEKTSARHVCPRFAWDRHDASLCSIDQYISRRAQLMMEKYFLDSKCKKTTCCILTG